MGQGLGCAVCLVPPFEKKQAKKRVMCAGKTFAPYGMKTGGAPPVVCKEYQPTRSGDLPPKVDLRNHMSPVEDQSQSNSCCANAVAGAFEYINMKHCKANNDEPADISRMFIYYVGRKRDQKTWGETGPVDDSGMSIGGAITAMQTHGACMEKDWPFTLKDVNKKPNDECFRQAQKYKVLDSTRIPVDLDSMRRCLAEGHPIVFGLKLTQNFFSPVKGFCATPNADDPKSAEHGLHAMLLVGYNDRQSIFIVRNSWGTSWGDGGYCYVPYDYIANDRFNMGEQYAIKGLTEVDFTPDDDDGADADLPGDDAGDAASVKSFDLDEDEELGDEDLDTDFDMLKQVKKMSDEGMTMSKIGLFQMGVVCANGDPQFFAFLDKKTQDDPLDKEYNYDDLVAFLTEFQDQK